MSTVRAGNSADHNQQMWPGLTRGLIRHRWNQEETARLTAFVGTLPARVNLCEEARKFMQLNPNFDVSLGAIRRRMFEIRKTSDSNADSLTPNVPSVDFEGLPTQESCDSNEVPECEVSSWDRSFSNDPEVVRIMQEMFKDSKNIEGFTTEAPHEDQLFDFNTMEGIEVSGPEWDFPEQGDNMVPPGTSCDVFDRVINGVQEEARRVQENIEKVEFELNALGDSQLWILFE